MLLYGDVFYWYVSISHPTALFAVMAFSVEKMCVCICVCVWRGGGGGAFFVIQLIHFIQLIKKYIISQYRRECEDIFVLNTQI